MHCVSARVFHGFAVLVSREETERRAIRRAELSAVAQWDLLLAK